LPDAGSLPGSPPYAAITVVASSPQPAAPKTVAAATSAAERINRVAQRLDALLKLGTLTLHTSEGDVSVPIPFTMNTPHEATRKDSHVVVTAAARRAGMTDVAVRMVLAGRGTPQQVARIAQQLIDEGKVTDATDEEWHPTLASRVRYMMWNLHVGMDCAGYVQQALLNGHGLTRERAALRAPMLEDLSGLSQRGYKSVALQDARTGDLMIFRPKPPDYVGHTAIVRDVHPSTAAEIVLMVRAMIRAPDFVANGKWTTFILDSSWGSHGASFRGGVHRVTFLQDSVSRTWAWMSERVSGTGRTPYHHEIEGIYRPKGN
jgi:cell wall-associated NlpC family hydrolase